VLRYTFFSGRARRVRGGTGPPVNEMTESIPSARARYIHDPLVQGHKRAAPAGQGPILVAVVDAGGPAGRRAVARRPGA
jgi:hypothetical protein